MKNPITKHHNIEFSAIVELKGGRTLEISTSFEMDEWYKVEQLSISHHSFTLTEEWADVEFGEVTITFFHMFTLNFAELSPTIPAFELHEIYDVINAAQPDARPLKAEKDDIGTCNLHITNVDAFEALIHAFNRSIRTGILEFVE